MGPRAGLDRCGKFPPTGIRSPDRPAGSKSLYRLSYPYPNSIGKGTYDTNYEYEFIWLVDTLRLPSLVIFFENQGAQ